VLGSAFDTSFYNDFDQYFDSSSGHTALAAQDGAENTNGGAGDDYMGEVYLTAATYPPDGTAFASGQTLNISAYSALFSLLGVQYGGNGSSTFQLPDLRKEAPAGLRYVIVMQGLYPSHP
jgi:microcystin-dependent protein